MTHMRSSNVTGRSSRVVRRRILSAAGSLLTIAAVGLAPDDARAAGSRVIAKSDGSPDGLYYPLDSPLSPLSAYVTEYAAYDFDPGDVIVGARVADYGPGESSGAVSAELRFEDPLRPGFPDLSSEGLVAAAAGGLDEPCGDATYRREISFEPLSAPSDRALYLVVRLPEGAESAPCGLQLDTSSAPLGASKCFLGSTGEFYTLRANHLAEIRVLREGPQDLGLDVHGSARYPGDAGRPVVFARRSNDAGRPSDDFITLDVVVDNAEPQPVTLQVDIVADVSEIAPNHLPIEITSRFRSLGSSRRLDTFRTFGRGRTVIRAELNRTLPRWSLGRLPAGVRFDAALVDPVVPSVPRDRESAVLGLRPAPGYHDDATSEQVLLVTEPSRAGDALAVRFPLADLPRVPFTVAAVEVVGRTLGDGSGLGFDAIEVRTEDPVLSGCPDPSALGLVRAVGVADGFGEVIVNPVLAPERFALDPLHVDPAAPGAANLWGQVVLASGHRFIEGSVLGADLDAPTLLGDSFYSEAGGLPYRLDPGRNYEIRLIVESWEQPLQASDPEDTAPIASAPGGYMASGGPRPVSVIAITGGGHGDMH
jgi:hypothetical protein